MTDELKLEVLQHLEECLTFIHKNKNNYPYSNDSVDWHEGYNEAVEDCSNVVEKMIEDLKK